MYLKAFFLKLMTCRYSSIKTACSSFPAPIRHYFPEPDAASCASGQRHRPALALRPPWEFHPSEDLSEPPSLRSPVSRELWLDGSIMISCSGYRSTACQSRFQADIYRSVPSMLSFWQTKYFCLQAVMTYLLCCFSFSRWTVNVSVLLDIRFSKRKSEGK